jgi:hypothetical protein
MSDKKPRKGAIHRTEEEKIELTKQICDLYAKGGYTIDSCVEHFGICFRTFRNWEKDISEIALIYKNARMELSARDKRDLRKICLTGLRKRAQGFEVEETEIKGTLLPNGEIGGKQIRKIKKYFPPDTTACIFGLNNTNNEDDPDFVNNYKQEVSGKIDIPIYETLPSEVIDALIKNREK